MSGLDLVRITERARNATTERAPSTWQRRYAEDVPALLAALAERDAQLDAVRALHVDGWITLYGARGVVCAACREPVESEPCSTIRALTPTPTEGDTP